MPAIASALASARVALFAGLAASGIALASAGGPPARDAVLRLAHAWSAEALLAVCIAELFVAFASGAYRAAAWRWLGRVALVGAVVVAYVLGAAAGPGEAGEEGMAHLARAMGATAPPAWWLVVALHALAAGAVATLGALVVRGGTRPSRAFRILGGSALATLALGLAWPAWRAARDLPTVAGAEAAHAPWPVRILSPFEEAGDATVAFLALGVALSLALLPLLDRREASPAWRRVAAWGLGGGALAFALLTTLVSFGPPGH